jgi:phosphosulfolactate synthase (CoM biosynthesis protein A)
MAGRGTLRAPALSCSEPVFWHRFTPEASENRSKIVRRPGFAYDCQKYLRALLQGSLTGCAAKSGKDRAMKNERAFSFLRVNQRQEKPRQRGITEIRGPYYSPMGKRYLQDILETMGAYVDSLKFAGGSFSLMPKAAVKELIDLCHRHEVLVSTGGFIEHVLTLGREAVDAYIDECRALGFDIVEISSGFITIPPDDWLRLTEKVQKEGLKAKPEIGIQFGAGGATTAEELAAEGVRDAEGAIRQAGRLLDAGAYMIMVESEGITENVKKWRTEVAARIANALGTEKVMFEAADPEVFAWYIKNYGAEVNLFVDHSQIVQLECLRSGIWGTKSLWGRVITYKE